MSKALVASSKSRIRGFLIRQRAMANLKMKTATHNF